MTKKIKALKGFRGFQRAMLDAGHDFILPQTPGEHKALGEATQNYLFNLPGPTEAKTRKTGRKIFFFKVFYGMAEILKSLETLEDIAFFIGRFPFQNTRISKERYLQFHVESYFSEVFLLQERLTKYLTLLERQYKRDSRLPAIRSRLKALVRFVTVALENPVRVRHSHVHEARFQDKDIDRLAGLALLMTAKGSNLTRSLRPYYRIEYARIKKKWKANAVQSNKTISKLLDMFFDELLPLVFDERSRTFNYPTRLKF